LRPLVPGSRRPSSSVKVLALNGTGRCSRRVFIPYMVKGNYTSDNAYPSYTPVACAVYFHGYVNFLITGAKNTEFMVTLSHI
jgi:hypothetical protein